MNLKAGLLMWTQSVSSCRQACLTAPIVAAQNLKSSYHPQTCQPQRQSRITEQQQDALPPAADSMSAPESVAATGPSAALAPSVGEGAAALRSRSGPCIRKFGLNLPMLAINLLKRPVKFKRAHLKSRIFMVPAQQKNTES